MNNIEIQYLELLKDILENGVKKGDRTGTGTISVFGRQIRHKMSEGFPLLTTKKMYFKGIITELLWFLRGDTNIKFLHDNDCHIWDGDYNKSGRTDGELGPIYGHQWRNWGEWSTVGDTKVILRNGVDQIKNLITDLKESPDSRRLMVSAWNVSEIYKMTLPPCHYGFQVYTRELTIKERFELWEKLPDKDVMDFPIGELTEIQYHDVLTKIGVPERSISLMYNTRSQDVPLGTPFNIASYALLLEIFGKMVNMVPDELISNMGDCHIYLNQIDGIREQLTREPYQLPKLIHLKNDDFYKSYSQNLSLVEELKNTDFKLDGYLSHPTIKMPLSN